METKIKPTYEPLPSGWHLPDKIELRQEQENAIADTRAYFAKALDTQHSKQGKKDTAPKTPKFLWNAKMRFGKTLSALELIRQMGIRRTLIVTHRPAVKDQWREDFNKIFTDAFATKSRFGYRLDHESADDRKKKKFEGVLEFDDLRKFAEKSDDHQIVFFVSMQYLRLSSKVGGADQSKEKARILDADWDMVIIDEAHEGTKTDRGENVIEYLARPGVMSLHLSGTPFNIYEQFSKDQIFSWDYPQEQEMKESWDSIPENEGNPNPYITLPRMNIMRYDMSRMVEHFISKLTDSDKGNMAIKDGEFKFTEFFRVNEDRESHDYGRFVHEKDVKAFIRKLRKEDDNNFPFSNDEFRRSFAHTLWIVPRVSHAKALEELLHEDKVFSQFTIINVAGKNDDDFTDDDALNRVIKRIDPKKGGTEERSITISCGRLTTGVTVRPWTAVLYMKGSDLTTPSTYMQTIFRVQSPYTFTDPRTGREMMKSQCYAFDFAPTRALNMVAETAVLATKISKESQKRVTSGKNRKDADRAQSLEHMTEMLRHLDMMSYDGVGLVPIDANMLFTHLNGAYADRITRNGFDDFRLFDFDAIDSMTPEERKALGEDAEWLKGVTSSSSGDKPKGSVPLDLTQLSEEQNAALEEARRKVVMHPEYEEWWKSLEKLERTMATFYFTQKGQSLHPGFKPTEKKGKKNSDKSAEETEADKLKAEQEKERKALASTLKSVAVRIPLLIYGAELKGKFAGKDITIDNITEIVDEDSWREFMPKSGDKVIDRKWFRRYKKFFHGEIFRLAGQNYRRLAEEADDMHTEERIQRITEIFSTFRNPDKETVLTPWPVVNMHMAETIGGHCFYNETFTDENTIEDEIEVDGVKRMVKTRGPRQIPLNEVSRQCFDNINPLSGESNTRILEINSKTGLYPLYVAYSIYRPLIDKYWSDVCEDGKNTSVKEEQAIWDQVLRENVFVMCKTDMARSITQRTLRGFRIDDKGNDVQVNAVYPQWTLTNNGKKPMALSYGREIAPGDCAKIDMVDILRLDSDRFEEDVRRREWWESVDPCNKLKFKKEMPKKITFDAVVGNPPYQGEARVQLYPYFYLAAKQVGDMVSMIFPISWQRPCAPTAKGLAKLNTAEVKQDKQIVFIDNRTGIFEDVPGANEVNFILWKKGSDNQLNGNQRVLTNGKQEQALELKTAFALVDKPLELQILWDCVKEDVTKKGSLTTNVTSKDPFHLPTDLFLKSSKYGMEEPTIEKTNENQYRVFGLVNKTSATRFISKDAITQGDTLLEAFKVFVPWAWGNMSKTAGLGGSYAKIFIGRPMDVCTMTYTVCGSFATEEQAIYQGKYMLTKFFRALLFLNKNVKTASKECYSSIPVQDFSENWWNDDISTINLKLYEKYEVPNPVREYINENIQDRDESYLIII